MLAGNLCRLAKVLSCRATMPLQRRVSLAARSDMVSSQQEQETRQDVGMNLSSGRLFPEREEWKRGGRATVRPVSPEYTLQWRVDVISEKNWINLNHMVVKVEASIPPYTTYGVLHCDTFAKANVNAVFLALIAEKRVLPEGQPHTLDMPL